MNPTRADIAAITPKAIAYVEKQGGYADAEDVERDLGVAAVSALLLAATTGERVEVMGGFLIPAKGRRS